METNFTPNPKKEFREVTKGCGIKYRNKIPSKELEAMLGYRPLDRRWKVEVNDETGFWKVSDSIKEVVNDCVISNSSAIKYALDHERPFITSRSDEKKSGWKKLIGIICKWLLQGLNMMLKILSKN